MKHTWPWTSPVKLKVVWPLVSTMSVTNSDLPTLTFEIEQVDGLTLEETYDRGQVLMDRFTHDGGDAGVVVTDL